MDRLTYVNSGNAAYIDSLYEAYKQDPDSVEFGWQKFFEGFDLGQGKGSGSSAGAFSLTEVKAFEEFLPTELYRVRVLFICFV